MIVTANFSGKSTDNRGMPDTRSLAMILVTLRGAKHTITASDTVRLTHRNNSGQPVRFDIRIPRSAARALAGRVGDIADRLVEGRGGIAQPARRLAGLAPPRP